MIYDRTGGIPGRTRVLIWFRFSTISDILQPVPVAARSKAEVCGRSPAEIVGSNPTGAWMFVCCECCVLSGRGLCDELITRPEESYRLCCVVVCDLETSRIGAPYIYDISHLRVKHKMCVLIFSTTFVWNTSDPKKNSARYYHKFTQVFM